MIIPHPECTCESCQPDPDWAPSDEHRALLARVEDLIAYWKPRMTWMDGWQVSVKPHRPGCGEWTARIEPANYVRTAVIEVRESALDEDDLLMGLDPVESMVVHELAHILFSRLVQVAYNWGSGDNGYLPVQMAMTNSDAEEEAVWDVVKTLLGLQEAPQATEEAPQAPAPEEAPEAAPEAPQGPEETPVAEQEDPPVAEQPAANPGNYDPRKG